MLGMALGLEVVASGVLGDHLAAPPRPAPPSSQTRVPRMKVSGKRSSL